MFKRTVINNKHSHLGLKMSTSNRLKKRRSYTYVRHPNNQPKKHEVAVTQNNEEKVLDVWGLTTMFPDLISIHNRKRSSNKAFAIGSIMVPLSRLTAGSIVSFFLLGGSSNAFIFVERNLSIKGFSTSTDDSTRLWATTSTLLPPAISIEDLSCTHNGGETWQLKDANYVLPRGSRTGLVGRNGCGKSTFLQILAENCREGSAIDTNFKYTGKVNRAKDARVAIVAQEPPMPSDVIVSDAVLGIESNNDATSASSKNVYEIVRRYRMAAKRVEDDPDGNHGFAEASAAMDACNGWSVLTKADEVATKLRVYHLYDQPLSQLSGGERKRVALCAALVEEPDVLLLDEPTNFLSLAGVQWLADLLQSDKKLSILMVTHDRAFLEEVCDRILELDRGSLYEHEGSYSSFLEAKSERLAIEDAAVHASKAKYRTYY